MHELVQVLMKLEDHILLENGLYGAGYVHFDHGENPCLGFPYIRFSHERFFRFMVRARELLEPDAGQRRFLEVGCGIGTKTEIARLLGFQATGFDLDPRYLSLARNLFPENRFLEGNALDFDYCGFDFIYWHTPLASEEWMVRLEQRALCSMTVGAYLCVTGLTGPLENGLHRIAEGSGSGNSPVVQVGLDDDRRVRCLRKMAGLTVGPDGLQAL